VYHTPGGDRVLLDAERSFFTNCLAMIVDQFADGDAKFGVAPFDELQRNQKLVVLYSSARGLLRPNEPIPKLTAVVESAVAIVYEFAKEQVFLEIDEPDSSHETSFWRRLILKAARQQVELDELPLDSDPDKGIWTLLIECLAGCVLWDNDYESQASLDLVGLKNSADVQTPLQTRFRRITRHAFQPSLRANRRPEYQQHR
jgi:hypothetical protein